MLFTIIFMFVYSDIALNNNKYYFISGVSARILSSQTIPQCRLCFTFFSTRAPKRFRSDILHKSTGRKLS